MPRVNCITRYAFFLAACCVAPVIVFANEGNDAAKSEFFERKIRPLLAKRCFECHSTQTADQSGNLVLDSKAGLTAGGSRGPILNSDKPDESLLLTALRYSDPKLQMPPDGKLPQDEIDLLANWVHNGAYVPD